MAKDNEAIFPHRRRSGTFTPALKAIWGAVALATVVTEVAPMPPLAPSAFYCIKATKVLLFLALGFLAPLALSRFQALNRGILLAVGSSTVVELLQGILRHGHSFHWYELVAKLLIILCGFAVALEVRYDRSIVRYSEIEPAAERA